MTERLSATQRRLAIGLVLGVTLVAFETTAVITALPTISTDLHGTSLYGVSISIYTLAYLVSLVAVGEIVDRRGSLLPYLVGIATFIGGLTIAATAPTMSVLVLGRLVQGAGAGALAPVAYVLVKRAFPDERQPMMFTFLSAGWVLPSLLAPFFGGLVTEHIGWRWVFAGIIPLALTVAGLAIAPMRAYGPADHGERRPTMVPRALAAASGVGVLITAAQAKSTIVIIVGVVAGATLAIPMVRGLLPPGVGLARRGLPAVIACRGLATAAFLGVDSFIPLAADRIHHVSPLRQGLLISGAAVVWTFGQWIMARRPDIDPAKAVRAGFALMFLSVGLVSPVLIASWPLWTTFVGWMVGGLGMGLLFNPTTVVSLAYATSGREGEVSSQVQLADSLGFSLMGGIGGAAVALADRTSWSLPSALATTFGLSALLAAIGGIAAGGIRRPVAR